MVGQRADCSLSHARARRAPDVYYPSPTKISRRFRFNNCLTAYCHSRKLHSSFSVCLSCIPLPCILSANSSAPVHSTSTSYNLLKLGKAEEGLSFLHNSVVTISDYLSPSSFFNQNVYGTGFAPEWRKNRGFFIREIL